MADDLHMADPAKSPVEPSAPDRQRLRDADGAVNPDFVSRVAEAIAAGHSVALGELVGHLHEADLGNLIEALEPDLRPRLVELAGTDFDFSALNEVDNSVREEILEELAPQTVAEGVRELETDDAVELLQDLPEEDQAEILDRLPVAERATLEHILDYPEDSAARRMQTEFIAVPPAWTVGRTIDYLRDTTDLPERFLRSTSSTTPGAGRARSPSTRCCGPTATRVSPG